MSGTFAGAIAARIVAANEAHRAAQPEPSSSSGTVVADTTDVLATIRAQRLAAEEALRADQAAALDRQRARMAATTAH